jgi:predicted nucleic acid-binding protein
MHYSFWTELSKYLIVLPFDMDCSNKAVEIFIDLSKSNKLIDMADILIGATAIAHKLPVATLNKKHFQRINNLHLEELNF